MRVSQHNLVQTDRETNNEKSELQGADDGTGLMGAFSTTYVNTGFPGLFTHGPVTHTHIHTHIQWAHN